MSLKRNLTKTAPTAVIDVKTQGGHEVKKLI
jgi:hypothetical protein